MAIALCIVHACYFGLHARGEPHCDSHPECSLSIFDLFHFLFLQKVHHSDVTCPSYSYFCAHSVSCLAPYAAMANI
uniref:Uncharacterized protein n=1 Tax=Setaria italica TaxID=4555 RepID=K3Y0K1_SETIT